MTAMPAARQEILELKSYKPGAQIGDTIRLNANEAPWSSDGDGLNRYPEVHPQRLRRRLAELFGVSPANLLVTRGSSEAIDVLIRAWCRAYRDSLITTPPTFEMYRVYANIQGVEMIDVPLDTAKNFALDADAVIEHCRTDTRLIFLCSPNNPSGTLLAEKDILKIVDSRAGKSVVVVDEAYIEFSDRESLAARVLEFENLVVLRTLSKAHALAGARCGAALGCEPIIGVLGKVLPPYSFPTPVIDTVIAALSGSRLEKSLAAVNEVIAERQRVFNELENLDCVTQLWPSQSNFILARLTELAPIRECLLDYGILIRDFDGTPGLENCARITIGTRHENDALLAALHKYGSQA